MLRSHIALAGLVFLLAFSHSTAQNALSAATPSIPIEEYPHKLQVSQRALGSRIIAGGGRMIADYGSSQLYEIVQLPPDLVADTHAVIRDEYNWILLNAAHLDTTKREVKALRKPLESFQGKR